MSTDRIERSITLQAPRSRVWRALTQAGEFGQWFGARLDGQAFAAGQRTHGPISIPGYEHIAFDVTVERMDPEDHFAYRWHPYPMGDGFDPANEPTTLVEFTLRDAEGGGTVLTVVESGFDALPAHRHDEAYRMNSGGWEGQMRNIAAHVEAG